jgi:methylated-DNA-[protein]-cysteine S-methyltransferase
MHTTTLPTPVGPFSLAMATDGVYAAGFASDPGSLELPAKPVTGVGDIDAVTAAVRAYFDGDVHALDAIAVSQQGSPFTRSAWNAMRQVPPGSTVTYTDLAGLSGNPGAARAAGAACARNLVPVIVPCHRIVRSDGSLGGYYYGLTIKRWLLAHEGAAG